MASNPEVADVSNKLHDAGALGLSAASFLGMFMAASPEDKGTTVSSDLSYVWHKDIIMDDQPTEVTIGIGKILPTPGPMSCTLGIDYASDLSFQSIRLIVNFFGSAESILRIQLDPENVIQGVPRMSGEDTIGFDIPVPHRPVTLELEATGLEFHFAVSEREDEPIIASLNLLNLGGELFDSVDGIYQLNFDNIMVFPKLNYFGCKVDSIFLDLSSDSHASSAKAFPDVYEPSWKGFGMTNFQIFYPLHDASVPEGSPNGDDENYREFLSFQAHHFYVQDNWDVSFDIQANRHREDPNHLVNFLKGRGRMEQGEFRQCEFAIGFDFARSVRNLKGQATSTDPDDVHNPNMRQMFEQVREGGDDNLIDALGVLVFQINAKWFTGEHNKVLVFEFVFDSFIPPGNRAGMLSLPHGIRFDGAAGGFANFIMLTTAIYSIIASDQGAGAKFSQSSVLLIFGMYMIAADRQELILSGMTLRYARASSLANPEQVDTLFQVDFNLRTRTLIDSMFDGLFAGIHWLREQINDLLGPFGAPIRQLRFTGPLDLEIQHLSFTLVPFGGAPSAQFEGFIENPPLLIQVRDLPRIEFDDQEGQEGVILYDIALVSRHTNDGIQFGLSFMLEGLSLPSFRLESSMVGVVFWMFPFSVEIVPQFLIEPKIVFAIPGLVFGEGKAEISKPLPSGGGTGNELSFDIGILHKNKNIAPHKLKEIFDFKKYKLRLGATYAWGEAFYNDNPAHPYDYCFLGFYIRSNDPLIGIWPGGPTGISGFAGNNIAPPGSAGNSGASGLLNALLAPDGEELLVQLQDWDPGNSAQAWHPDTTWDSEAEDVNYRVGFGGGVKAEMTDALEGTLGLVIGFPSFYFALAGDMICTDLNIGALTGIAYVNADKSVAFNFMLYWKFPKDSGSIITFTVPLQVGVRGKSPKGFSFFLGHYNKSKGAPLLARFLSLFNIMGYVVFDWQSQVEFGFSPIRGEQKPTLGGGAFAFGAMFMVGPKKFGPNIANISLFFAAGANVGIAFDADDDSDELGFYADIFIGGGIHLNIFVFRFSLELLAKLSGFCLGGEFCFKAELVLRIGLPWPWDDYRKALPWLWCTGDIDIPTPTWNVDSMAHFRLENKTVESPEDEKNTVPIDGIIALAFSKQINTVIPPGEDADPCLLSLLLNDEGDVAQNIIELTETKVDDVSYQIRFVYNIERLKVTWINDNEENCIDFMDAVWALPNSNEREDIPQEKMHQLLYLNAHMPPGLQFANERIGSFMDWRTEREHVSPCEQVEEFCITSDPQDWTRTDQPNNEYEPAFLTRDSPVGEIKITQHKWFFESDDYIGNIQDLELLGEGEKLPLLLPNFTTIDHPNANGLSFSLTIDLSIIPERIKVQFRERSRAQVDHLYIRLNAYSQSLRDSYRFKITLTPDGGIDDACLFSVSTHSHHPARELIDFDVQMAPCADPFIVQLSVTLTSHFEGLQLAQLQILGFHFVLDSEFMLNLSDVEFLDASSDLPGLIDLLEKGELRLNEFCLSRGNDRAAVWDEFPPVEGSNEGEPPNRETTDAMVGRQLMQPGKDYKIEYSVRATGSIGRVHPQGGLRDMKNKTFVFTTQPDLHEDDEVVLEQDAITFKTEEIPSQDVEAYVAFSYPGPATTSPYTESLIPLIGFKNHGLILKIFERYGGEGTLTPKIYDTAVPEPNLFEPEVQQSFRGQSGPSDQFLEDLYNDCFPDAADVTRVDVHLWLAELDTSMEYALQLENNFETNQLSATPYNRSFRTSGYRNLSEHVVDLHTAMAQAQELPISDLDTYEAILNEEIQKIENGDTMGLDVLIEAIYLRVLNTEGGRLGTDPTSYFAGWMVGVRNLVTTFRGLVLEMPEPLLSKTGVEVEDREPDPPRITGGVIELQNNLLIIRDRAASRLIILPRQGNGFGAFERLDEAQRTISFAFDPMENYREALRDHFTHADGNARPGEDQQAVDARIDAAISENVDLLTQNDSIGDRLSIQQVPFIIRVPGTLIPVPIPSPNTPNTPNNP